ncbi:Radical SAM domain protein [Gloeothece citriformis PCC 7424]|uniref:Radical SAM domain protein n=1 Tax=Gloeothece citriformis (strain PCC 7424) TaxID=65393 RepID=B7KCL6_GLOC7|nr:radical SAM protein [Gloeothece citriformis]ACK71567.1 Radical SAM domain protein [Gloeothece citriformis PCC 7424]
MVNSGLKGFEFNFDTKIAHQAMEKNQMLVLGLDFSPICHLNCSYCDRIEARKKIRKELSLEQKIELIKEAKTLGCQTVEIPGAGEPLLDPHFWTYLEVIAQLDMIPLVFTSGYSKKGCLINDNVAKKLHDLGASIVLKFESMDKTIQDNMVRQKGYGEICYQTLDTLIKAGFTDTSPTRLGIHTVVTPHNIDDVLNIVRMSRQNNIFPYISPLIPGGNALDNDGSAIITREESLKILNVLAQLDKTFGIDYTPTLPVSGGFVCNQINVGVFINLYGDIFECSAGESVLGNVIEVGGLKQAWNLESVKQRRLKPQNGYCPSRETYWDSLSCCNCKSLESVALVS